MTNEQKENYKLWLAGAEEDYETAVYMMKKGLFSWALFVSHLAIEKTLKAMIISQENQPLFIHDLNRLAKQANVVLSPDYVDWLDEITTFHIAARYREDKLQFKQKATKQYSIEWMDKCKQVYIWLKQQIN